MILCLHPFMLPLISLFCYQRIEKIPYDLRFLCHLKREYEAY